MVTTESCILWNQGTHRSTQSNAWLHILWKRNQAVGDERCATRFNHGGTEYEEVYDRSGANVIQKIFDITY